MPTLSATFVARKIHKTQAAKARRRKFGAATGSAAGAGNVKLKIHPRSSRVSATRIVIRSRPSFRGTSSWLWCQIRSRVHAAVARSKSSSAAICRPRITTSASCTYASTSNPSGS